MSRSVGGGQRLCQRGFDARYWNTNVAQGGVLAGIHEMTVARSRQGGLIVRDPGRLLVYHRHQALLVCSGGAILVVIGLYLMTGKARIAPSLSYRGVKDIDLGMSSQMVVSVLGVPLVSTENNTKETYLSRKSWGSEAVTYDPGRIVTFTYAEPRWGRIFLSQPALWIRFLDGNVWEVYAKEYCMGDDGVVYALSCDMKYEHPAFRTMFPVLRDEHGHGTERQ